MKKKQNIIHLVSVRCRNGDELWPAPLMRDYLGLSQRQHQQATREIVPRNVTPVLAFYEPKQGFWVRLILAWVNFWRNDR